MNNDLQEAFVLDNGKEYLVLDRIMYNRSFYLLLVAANDDDDEILIQKEILKDNELQLEPITSDEEFNEVISRFSQKEIRP